jgi:HECT-domain (ubiquitin-transferase)
VRPLYKHILGWPIAFSDLEHTDHYMHDSLLKMTKMDDVSVCGIDFTVTEEMLGDNLTVELKPGGEQITVSNDNLNECKFYFNMCMYTKCVCYALIALVVSCETWYSSGMCMH